MAYRYPLAKLNSDHTFGPTDNGNFYLPVNYHNRTANIRKGKNKWAIKQNEQYGVFRIADEKVWYCHANNCLFSILDDGREIFGFLSERIGYFVKPVNTTDPWHGYPVFSSEFIISEDLLDLWERNKVISPKIRKKIGTCQL